MEEAKKWWQSKAVWGGLVAVLASIANAFGVAIAPEVQGQVADLILTLVGAGGGVLAIYGRVKADTKIAKGK